MIGVENYSSIAWREIAGADHLVDVAAGGAEQKQRRPHNRRQAKVEAAAKGQEAHHREAEAGETDLELERAVRPADELRAHLAEERVHHEIVEEAHADREQEEPGEQGLDHDRRRKRLRRAQERNAGGDQSDHQEGEREVREEETNDVFHGTFSSRWRRS